MSGGLAEQSRVIDLGDIILEVNNIPIHSAEDLSALVTFKILRLSSKFLIFKLSKVALKWEAMKRGRGIWGMFNLTYLHALRSKKICHGRFSICIKLLP